MIRKPKNWENVKAATDRIQRPAGGYLAKIVAAKTASYNTDMGGQIDRLEIALDIADGEYKDFYQADYDSGKRQSEDYKWKGVLRQYLPMEDGSENDEWRKSSLKAMMEAIEDSNGGYRYDWDKPESQLKGKTVGCVFRLEEWAMNGKKGWKAQPFKFVPVEAIRTGKFKMPNFKPHRDYPNDTPDNFQSDSRPASSAPAPSAYDPIDDEGDLPFN